MTTNLLVIIILALSSNLDNIGVASSYGIRKISIPFSSNLLIAFITGTGTLASMLAGRSVYKFLDPQTAGTAGAAIIIAVGVWVLFKEMVMRKPKVAPLNHDSRQSISHLPVHRKINAILDNPFMADMDFSGHISLKEGMLLGIALTFNNLANGIGAGMMGLSVTLTTALVVVFSILTIWVGLEFGNHYGVRWLGKSAGPAAGLLLILVGIYEMLF